MSRTAGGASKTLESQSAKYKNFHRLKRAPVLVGAVSREVPTIQWPSPHISVWQHTLFVPSMFSVIIL
jgi:hypothetical protein